MNDENPSGSKHSDDSKLSADTSDPIDNSPKDSKPYGKEEKPLSEIYEELLMKIEEVENQDMSITKNEPTSEQ
jgi:hypothetical protein